MKGFFPLVIEALLPLLDQSFRQSLMTLSTCDEESSMASARALTESGRPLGRATAIGGPTNLRPIRLHEGVTVGHIEILGQGDHSLDPNPGRSALKTVHTTIGKLTALRGEWQQAWSDPQFNVPRPALNFGCIYGGDSPSRICSQRLLELDLRPPPGMRPKQLREVIR